ncbi:MAG: hypothetical protein KAS21_02880 [Candidatus Aminicenantes bacterium]|nr:hypothetical protein [Candidatus Aminicenantes bacterium]
MKNISVLLLIVFCVFSVGLFSQEKVIREDMVVINVEVPVRVMHKGKPVDNLKKSDFRLFENGKVIDINGFNIVRKKISSQSIELDSEREQFYKPRLFVLAFSVTNFNRFYEKGVRYFFDNVLRESDKLLVFVNNLTLTYNDLKDKRKTLEDIILALNKEGKIARKNIRLALMRTDSGVRNLVAKLKSPSKRGARAVAESEVLSFFMQYHASWKMYKRSYLTMDIYTLYNFAAFLKRITLEKWVISFYQYERFPVINFDSSGGALIASYMGRESRRIAGDVSREFTAGRTFPYEEISKMYYNLGATFNLVVIPTRIETDSEATKTANLSTAAEITLREIAKRTGGSVSFSTDLTKSLEKIIEKEDITYLLTYAPEDSSRRGKLKIKLKGMSYKLLYDNNQRAGFIKRKMRKYTAKEKMVKIEDLQFLDKKLFFKMINFKQAKQKKIKSGKIQVNIIVKGDMGEILFDENKILSPGKKATEMSVSFDWLKQGKYDLIIDVRDMLTNYKAFEYLKIEVK